MPVPDSPVAPRVARHPPTTAHRSDWHGTPWPYDGLWRRRCQATVDQRSNAYGQGAGWPPGHGADVAYPIDEHPSHPPAPWASLPADPAAWGIDPASAPSWDTGSWTADPGAQ